MRNRSLIAAVLAAPALAGLAGGAQAQNGKAQFDAETARIASRYTQDKKLCSDQGNSGARMQCLRDAKTEYDKSMARARDQYQGKPCHECGKVSSVVVSEKAGESSALGVIAGGVAGALLGNQAGSGHGRQVATVAGAAGGAYAGKKIEEKAKSSKQWTVHVRYDDGRAGSFQFDHDPRLLSGDRVEQVNGSIARR